MTTTKTTKPRGTCPVCLRVLDLRGDRNVRHGWAVQGAGGGHGQVGAWHVGRCAGTSYPHLGVSSEGTVWALGRVRELLEGKERRLAELDARPPLTWTQALASWERRRGTKPEVRELRDGTPADYRIGAPSYEDMLRRVRREVELEAADLRRTINLYEVVLADWSPAKYPVVQAPVTTAIVHLKGTWRRARPGLVVPAPECKRLAFNYSERAVYTDDEAEVTCKRCLAILEQRKAQKELKA